MRTPSYVVGIVKSGKGLSFAAKRHGACAVEAGVEVFVAGLCGWGYRAATTGATKLATTAYPALVKWIVSASKYVVFAVFCSRESAATSTTASANFV